MFTGEIETDITRSEPSALVSQPIANFIADEDKTIFDNATKQVIGDDSKSVHRRFWLALPAEATLAGIIAGIGPNPHGDHETVDRREAVEIDANGILIHDRMTGAASHV